MPEEKKNVFNEIISGINKLRTTIATAKEAGVPAIQIMKAQNIMDKAKRDLMNINTGLKHAHTILNTDIFLKVKEKEKETKKKEAKEKGD